MAKQEQRLNLARLKGSAACMALTPKVLGHLQVCVSGIELLEGMSLPAEAHRALARLSRAVDALAAAAATARRPATSIEAPLSGGCRGERS